MFLEHVLLWFCCLIIAQQYSHLPNRILFEVASQNIAKIMLHVFPLTRVLFRFVFFQILMCIYLASIT